MSELNLMLMSTSNHLFINVKLLASLGYFPLGSYPLGHMPSDTVVCEYYNILNYTG